MLEVIIKNFRDFQNNDMSRFYIGYMYANGLGVEKDYAKAIEFYEKVE